MDISKYQTFSVANLGFAFNDPELLATALTHRSYVNEHRKSAKEHNERLEFLGDAVLELVVTDYLFKNRDDAEGVLTSLRSALVRTESISAAGARVGLEELLRLSRGERNGSERARMQILANAFEAVIGAIYLDQGYEQAKEFITKNILITLDEILASGSWRDAKSYLQERAQSLDNHTPVYKVIDESGPDHDKVFTLGVYVGPKLMGKGKGHSKQIAQQEAAREALKAYEARNKTK